MNMTTFKLLKTTGGFCHFAQVTLEGKRVLDGVVVREALRLPVVQQNGEVDPQMHPDWWDSALDGARVAAEMLIAKGWIAGCDISIVTLVGLEVDTLPADVWCAAAMAVFSAFVPEEQRPSFRWADNHWHLDFPVSS